MTGRFSGAVLLTDLNDYVAPSQACVKPVAVEREAGAAATEIRVEGDGVYTEVAANGAAKRLRTAKITLNDCLACSGCITSAESVLIEAQSHHELLRVLRDGAATPRLVVVSIAPQSRASFAAKYGMGPLQVARRLTAFFKLIGCHAVFDTSFARDLALLESQREFVRRFRAGAAGTPGSLPMLASTCPGWVCYAEKKHGQYVLPYISTTKSSQQIMGALVKSYYAQRQQRRPDEVFHVAVMPCYDKKLEASRQDFYDDVYRTRDVDLVITTGEVEMLLDEEGVDLRAAPEAELDREFSKLDAEGRLLSSEGSTAGGFLESVFRHAAHELFGVRVNEIAYATVRGADHREVTLEVGGQVMLRFATAYGFRNIQNFVRKVKHGAGAGKPYHFVEIMACPSACINGGGQLKQGTADGDRALTADAEAVYRSLPYQAPEANEAARALYRDWLGDSEDEVQRRLHTTYRAVAFDPTLPSVAASW